MSCIRQIYGTLGRVNEKLKAFCPDNGNCWIAGRRCAGEPRARPDDGQERWVLLSPLQMNVNLVPDSVRKESPSYDLPIDLRVHSAAAR